VIKRVDSVSSPVEYNLLGPQKFAILRRAIFAQNQNVRTVAPNFRVCAKSAQSNEN